MQKYGEAVYEISDFEGFRHYTKNKEEIIEIINTMHLYLKMNRKIYYFEHNDCKNNDYDEEKKLTAMIDWVVFSFDNIENRTTDSEYDGLSNDLFIAIDVISNGGLKLRIKSPDYCVSEFSKLYENFNEKERFWSPGFFTTSKEDEFLYHIKELIKVI